MRGLAPYQLGLWLAEYVNIRCQLCGCYRSVPQYLLDNPTHKLPSSLRRATLTSSLLCIDCHHSIPWLPSPFDVDIVVGNHLPIQAATYYDYPIRQAIQAFKHSEDMTKLPLLVHLLRQLPRPKGCHAVNSVIVPMPTTHERLIKRGFDPVTILSAYLAKHWQIPLWHGIERIDNTLSQQGLTRSERLTNLNDAFIMIERPPVKRLLLFDDVATTGASLQALARACYPTNGERLNDDDFLEPLSNSTTATQSTLYQLTAYALAHGSHHKR